MAPSRSRRNSLWDRGKWLFIEDEVEAWQPARVVKQEPGGNATLELSGRIGNRLLAGWKK
jgi:hypothetical protein